MQVCKNSGFSRGPFVYYAEMRFAPQETRSYLVTAVTAERRRIFQVTATPEAYPFRSSARGPLDPMPLHLLGYKARA